MQLVGRVDGVTYINDSKATNTGAVNSGLEQAGGPVILIAGGKDKGDDYHQLREAVHDHVKYLLLIGEAAQDMGEALSDLAETEFPKSLEDAVKRAADHAEPGDTVLLSPACASFDMFESYIQRGERFVAAVRDLQELSVAGGTG
jgi:UDP-N-acetylmuramoylalanine--D-glutamate ligase